MPKEIKSQADLDNLSEGDLVIAIDEGIMLYTEKGHGRQLLRRRSKFRILATDIDGSWKWCTGLKIIDKRLYVRGRIWPPHDGNCKPYNLYDKILKENGL
jgi:hypothetical protein